MAKTTFAYRVVENGKEQRGTIEADSEHALIQTFRNLGVVPLEISETGTGLSREIRLFGEKRVKLKELAVFTRNLATLISAVPLAAALRTLSEQADNPTLKRVLGEVYEDVNNGKKMSDALARHEKVFPFIMVAMLRAAEESGELDSTLVQLAENFEADVKLRQQIKSAMAYPVVVFILAIIMCVVMLVFIVPIFADMFTSLGGKLPLPTRILVFMSHAMKYVIPAGAVGAVAFVWWWRNHKNDERVRDFVDPLKLKMPVFGKLSHKIALARFSRNLAHLLEAGVPILKSLDIVSDTVGNVVFSRVMVEAKEGVNVGEPMNKSMMKYPEVIPPMTLMMIKNGEDSANLDHILHSIAKDYDQQVEATTDALASLIEPLMIAFLAVIVGGMIVALYMPIFKIFDMIQ